MTSINCACAYLASRRTWFKSAVNRPSSPRERSRLLSVNAISAAHDPAALKHASCGCRPDPLGEAYRVFTGTAAIGGRRAPRNPAQRFGRQSRANTVGMMLFSAFGDFSGPRPKPWPDPLSGHCEGEAHPPRSASRGNSAPWRRERALGRTRIPAFASRNLSRSPG